MLRAYLSYSVGWSSTLTCSPLPKLVWGEGLGVRGRNGGKMKKPLRRSRRDRYAIAFARDQRRQANEFSSIVWQIVRNRGCRKQKFRREYSIPPYTADFCCVVLKLIIEIDGEHHQTEEGRGHDARRDQFLARRGFAVVRIPGYEVLRDPAAVRCLIENAIDARIAQLGPLTDEGDFKRQS